ncbi:hypothetical protein UFOVP447_232 [uncultured Caudovirales phage]|uniref:Uncharacterized protein n=1 Tax=uncultured Caudovirales phage TaxID=2100421 RepID=A0A6J5MBR0_9CAUD|nr:hypothetical protein UFOVP447_232 [uncultured Caudovirales phage]
MEDIQHAIKLIQQFRDNAPYTDEIKWELDSIEKFYKIKLYALKKVTDDARVDKN